MKNASSAFAGLVDVVKGVSGGEVPYGQLDSARVMSAAVERVMEVVSNTSGRLSRTLAEGETALEAVEATFTAADDSAVER
ncbi:hypothetical protein GCM10010412_091710 [Nonomuraea recticatena]|uniref:Uncharacterized protein n=2 Tax=Nonomuraea recticatena TaxID=46178 RepID=A0ABP6FQ82_9ACTN